MFHRVCTISGKLQIKRFKKKLPIWDHVVCPSYAHCVTFRNGLSLFIWFPLWILLRFTTDSWYFYIFCLFFRCCSFVESCIGLLSVTWYNFAILFLFHINSMFMFSVCLFRLTFSIFIICLFYSTYTMCLFSTVVLKLIKTAKFKIRWDNFHSLFTNSYCLISSLSS